MAVNIPSLQSLVSGLEASVGKAVRSAFEAQDRVNTSLVRMLNFVPDWRYPELLNGWLPFSATRFPRYRLEKGIGGWYVRMEGRVASGTVGATTPICVMPEGWWPEQDVAFAVPSNAAFGQLSVRADNGWVVANIGSNVNVDMNVTYAIPKGVE